MSDTVKSLRTFEDHATNTVMHMKEDISMGCRLELATAFAVVAIRNFRLANTPGPQRSKHERLNVRLIQAVQIAIDYYGTEQAIGAIGVEEAEIMRREYLAILYQLAGN